MLQIEDRRTAAAVSGDQEALTDLLKRHDADVRERLDGTIDKAYRGALDVDDVLQVTYMEAFLRISQFTPGENGTFLAWLTRIAENNLVDAVRFLNREKRPPPGQRIQPAGGEESYMTLLSNLVGSTTTPSRAAARAEVSVIVDEALADLPADYAKAIRLYDLEGLPIEEVAQAFGRSHGAVHMLRARALDRLRELLGRAGKFFTGSA
jgi:RNA polymerase sigma-70 factor (ECF subfamily)